MTDALLQSIRESDKLSQASKDHYISKATQLCTITGHDLAWVVAHPKETMQALSKAGKTEPMTQRAYITTIQAVIKYNPEQHAHRTQWAALFTAVDTPVQNKYKNNTASERQLQAYVRWDDILKRREELPRTSDEYLVLSLFTLVPPVRSSDLCSVRLVKSPTDAAAHPNRLLLRPDGSMQIHIAEFKAKSDRLPHIEYDYPAALCSIIKESLRRQPRDYLLVSPQTQRPYADPNSFTKYVNRTLQKVFGKPVTVNTLRHSFITSLDLNKLTSGQKLEIANMMGQTNTQMQDFYRLLDV